MPDGHGQNHPHTPTHTTPHLCLPTPRSGMDHWWTFHFGLRQTGMVAQGRWQECTRLAASWRIRLALSCAAMRGSALTHRFAVLRIVYLTHGVRGSFTHKRLITILTPDARTRVAFAQVFCVSPTTLALDCARVCMGGHSPSPSSFCSQQVSPGVLHLHYHYILPSSLQLLFVVTF